MWKVIGASVTGTSHEAAGKGCEDACGWREENGVTILAVADGAGSRARSAEGAELAVDQALQLAATVTASISQQPGPADRMHLVFAEVKAQIADLAQAEGNDIGDYAATLAVAVLSAEVVCVGQVGDTIAVIGYRGSYETLAPAPRAEYVNETSFVTDDDAAEQVRISVRQAGEADALFLSTDGLRFKILANLTAATPFTPFFEDAQEFASSLDAKTGAIRQFLAGLDDQSGDDKTLLAAVRTADHPASATTGASTASTTTDGTGRGV
jgi:hypothetical protein